MSARDVITPAALAIDPALVALDWAWAVLDALAAAGARHVVISPGSRSTPLALAAARHPLLELVVMLDERAAGFHALGLARGADAPVVLVSTSGTAAANYHPALAEAAGWGVPLIALTADRPARLRGLGAPQTIDQVRLFGPTAVFVELPPPVASVAGRRAMALRVALAVASAAGPLHLNLPFDEPLVPAPAALAAWRPPAERAPRVSAARPSADGAALAEVAARLLAAERPVMLAGPGAGEHGAAEPLLDLAAAVGMPVLADVGSALRGRGAGVLVHADVWLRGAPLDPDLLVLVGAPPTSKAVAGWAAGCGAPAVGLWPDARGRDPQALAELVVVGDVADAAARLRALVARPGRSPGGGRAARPAPEEEDTRVAAAITAGTPPIPREAAALRAAARQLPPGGLLVLSNSMPIRHADTYLGDGPPGVRPIVLRGANGIDGVTAAALGAARGAAAPTLLVTGDLAFLHDMAGLTAARGLATPVAILVLDNDGGAIFRHLPVAEATAEAELARLFTTPQGLDLARLAALHELPCAVVDDPAEAGEAVAEALGRLGASVVLFRADAHETVAAHRAFVAALAGGACA